MAVRPINAATPPSAVGGVTFVGTWNAFTNTPNLNTIPADTGDYYIVAIAGSTTVDGISSWGVGDWAVFNGSTWNKIDNTDSVLSVVGRIGNVTLTINDISATIIAKTNLLASPYLILTTDDTVLMDPTAGGCGATLPDPASVTPGKRITVKRVTSGPNLVTIGTAAGLIDGVATCTLFGNTLQGATFVSDSANWWLI